MRSENRVKKQYEFLDWEIGAFFHYGIRTFNEENRDWDMKLMDPKTFNPTKQDCRSWIKAVKECGATYAIFTTKHHDGFANWPSNYTEFSVKNSSYNGDTVKEFVEACREYDMKCGLYYSCAQFDTKDLGEAYDDVVVGQLTELLSNYGKIDYLWFDTCGSQGHEFDTDRIIKTIRGLQPELLIFGPWDDDVRWIGNEWGLAHDKNLCDRDDGKGFMPGECDFCITRNQRENFWFYNDTHKDCVRTVDELVAIYDYSVGRGSNMLINIAPDRNGLLPEKNVQIFKDAMAEVKRRAVDCKIGSSAIINEGDYFYINLDKMTLIDYVEIEEDITDGESVLEFDVEICSAFSPDEQIGVVRGYTIGHKRICTFAPIRGQMVCVHITKSKGIPKIKAIRASFTKPEKIFQI